MHFIASFQQSHESDRVVTGWSVTPLSKKRVKERAAAAVIEGMLEAVAIIDLDGTIRQVNSEFERGLGWKKEEAIGKTPIELGIISKEEVQKIEKEVMPKLMEEGFVQNIEIIVICRDGTKFPALMNWTLMKDAEGKPTGIITVARDITELNKTEEEIIRLSSAVKMSTDSIVISDLEGNIIDVNEATLEMYGTDDKRDLIGKNSFDLIAPEDREEAFAGMKAVLEKGCTKGREYRIIIKDGSKIHVEMNTGLMKDADGKPIGFVGTTRDITERKRKSAELERAAKEWQETFDAITDIVALISPDFRLIRINRAGCEAIGKKPEELIGKKCYEVMHGLDAPIDGCPCTETIRTKKARVGEITQGGKLYIATACPILDKNNELTAFAHTVKDITERKRAEEEIRRSNESLAEAQRIAHMGSWDWDIVANEVSYSDEIYRIWGVNREDYRTYDDFAKLYHPDDAERNIRAVEDALGGKNPYNIEYRIVRPDGTIRWVHVRGEVLFNKEGKPVRMIGSTQNITESKWVEEALRESEQKLRVMFESISDGISLIDLEGKVVDVNEAHLHMFGYSHKGELVGQSAFGNIVGKDRARAMEGLGNLSETGFTAPAEYMLRGKDGREFYGEVSAALLRDSFENPAGVISVIRDITERKRAEEALRESEERYRALFESSADGILVADVETREFKYANPAICRMLGFSEEELKGMGVSDIHPKDELEHVISEFEAQARGEKTLAPNIPCLRKDGTIMYANINTTKALIDGKECAIGFFRDITELKRAEEIIRSLRDVGVAIQKTMDEETIFNIVGRGLDKLGLRPTIYMLDEEKNARIKRNVLPPAAVAFAERLVGLKLNGFSIPVDKVPAFRDVVREQKTVVLHNPAETIGQFLVSGEPSRKKQAAKLAGLFGTESAICSPLVVKGKVVGIFTVCSKHLVGGETATIVNTFAYQMGTAIENARLYEEVKQELAKRNRAEEEIGKLRTPVAGIDIGDLEPKLVYLNDAFAEMHGYSAKELIGKNIAILHNNEQIGEFEEVIHKVKTQGSWKGEIDHVKKDSTTFPVYMSATLLKNEKRKPIEILAVCRDITKRKEAGAQIEAA